MTKNQKINKISLLIVFSLILFIIAIIMALISTSKITAKKEELLEYSEKSYIDYEIKDEEVLINFNYSFLADKKLSLDYNYDINVEIVATNKDTGKYLYYDQIVLVPTKKISVLDTITYAIKEPVSINYEEYNEMIKENLNEQILNNTNAYLVISLNTNTISDSFSEKLRTHDTSSINIPLLKNDVVVTKKELNETNSLFGIKEELVKNKNLFVLSIIMVSLASLVLIVAFILFLKNPNIENSYNKEYKQVTKILRDYDELIKRTYRIPTLKDKKIIEVFNIADFVTLRDKYDLPITMVDKEDKFVFIMIYNNKAWLYSIEKK